MFCCFYYRVALIELHYKTLVVRTVISEVSETVKIMPHLNVEEFFF